MSYRVSKKHLEKIAAFDSGPDRLGTDYYVVYKVNTDEKHMVVNCSGVAVGWEFDRWEAVRLEGRNSSDVQKLLKARSNREKCRLYLDMDRMGADIEE